jgi:hypothetical protein
MFKRLDWEDASACEIRVVGGNWRDFASIVVIGGARKEEPFLTR